jgi:O-antigen/teichoic acid export membrane protein
VALIRKHAARNTVVAYFGVILGYVNLTIIFPKLLEQSVFGLTQVLIAAMLFISNFGSLGLKMSTIRFRPVFESKQEIATNFFAFMLTICLIGIALSLVSLYVFQDFITDRFSKNSPLFVDYYRLVYWLAIFGVTNMFLDSYCQSIFQSIVAAFYREVVMRLLQLAAVLLYWFGFLDLNGFLVTFVMVQALYSILIGATLILGKHIVWNWNFENISKSLRIDIAKFSIIAIIGGNALLTNVDVLFVGSMIGLEATAIYAVAVAIGNILLIPSRSMLRVANAVAADAWVQNDLPKLNRVYKKSAITNLIIGGVVFLIIAHCIPEILSYLPKNFEAGTATIIVLALSKLIHLSTGINSGIIATSKDYAMNLVFNVMSAFGLWGFMYFLIPMYGIMGAAMAMLYVALLQNTAKVVFLQTKYELQPYNRSYFVVILIGLFTYLVIGLIPEFWTNPIIGLGVKASLTTALFLGPIYFFKLSNDFNLLVGDVFKKLKF